MSGYTYEPCGAEGPGDAVCVLPRYHYPTPHCGEISWPTVPQQNPDDKPPISREDLETVCEAAEGMAITWDNDYGRRGRQWATDLRAAIARMREGIK